MKTLQDIISQAAKGGKGIFAISGQADTYLAYADLYRQSLVMLKRMQDQGMKPRQEVVLYVEQPIDFLVSFWACILGGFIPVPITASLQPEHLRKLENIWRLLEHPWLITDFDLQKAELSLSVQRDGNFILRPEKGEIGQGAGSVRQCEEEEVAFIQFSSGSTGEPKGVMLTHRNLLANIRAIQKGMEFEPDGRCLNWMPFTHDMGLIGGHLVPLAAGAHQYQMPTALFIRRPSLWLKKVSEHRIHYLSSPNFGYKFVLDYCRDKDLEGLDLSGVRLIFNGAEPISPTLCAQFMERLQPCGLQPNTMFPVYGMAEASLAVAFPPIGEAVRIVKAERRSLAKGERVRVAGDADAGALFVDEGYPVQDCAVRICGEQDEVLPDWTIGHIQIQGDNVTQGYYRNPEATRRAFTADGWLRTGDLGFMRDGRLVVTGREKDILFVNGQNVYPHDLEAIAIQVEGVERGRIAACGVRPNEGCEDELLFFLAAARTNWDVILPLADSVRQAVKAETGLNVNAVIPVRHLPKTTSGKLQRYKLAEQYMRGDYEELLREMREQGSLRQQASVPLSETNAGAQLLALVQRAARRDQAAGDSFYEWGIDSLKLAYLSELLAETYGVEISVPQLLELGSLTRLSAYLEEARLVQENVREVIPIHGAGRTAAIPALPNQRRLYVLEQLGQAGTANHITIALQMPARIDIERLQAALLQLADAHASLRMAFADDGRDLYWRVYASVPVQVERIEGQGGYRERIAAWQKPYTLNRPPLWRVGLLHDKETDKDILVLDFHHTITDGSSVLAMLENLFRCMSGEAIQGEKATLADFCVWRLQREGAGDFEAPRAYWLGQFSEPPQALELPTDRKRPPAWTFKGDSLSFEAGADLTAKLRQLAQATGVTPYMVLLAAYYVWLSKVTGEQDIVIGSPLANREHAELRRTGGMLINTLPLRLQGQAEESFARLLQHVKQKVREALANQAYYTEELVEQLQLRPTWDRNALYDVVFVMQQTDLALPEEFQTVEWLETARHTAKVDLSLEAAERAGKLGFVLEYSSDLFERDTIRRLADYYIRILEAVALNPDTLLAQISLVGPEERRLLDRFQHGQDMPGECLPFPVRFAKQALREPGRLALHGDKGGLSYGELYAEADRLTCALQQRGVGREAVVGILMESGPKQLAACLAVWQAGGACLPIDLGYPDARIRYMVQDTEPVILIVDAAGRERLAGYTSLVPYDLLWQEGGEGGAGAVQLKQGDLALLLYTSGTTGEPKGVMLEHGSLSAYIDAFQREFKLSPEDVVLQQASFAFDNYIEEVLPALTVGASLVMMQKVDVLDMPTLAERLEEEQVTVISCSSQLVHEINQLPLPSSLRLVISGGDTLKPESVSNLMQHCAVYNTYGPTEATVCAAYYCCNPEDERFPIGKPISGYQIYLADGQGNPVPVGVPGEICVAGPGVARGYWGKPELTAERFGHAPFAGNERIYRTGDQARWLPDGNLIFLGRADQQIKIRGYRVELSEVEKAIEQCSGVAEARVVPLREGEHYTALCAYFVGRKEWSAAELRRQLSEHLPDYMLPAYYVAVDRIPLTVHGKLDRSRLPDPALAAAQSRNAEAPRDELERGLACMWSELLRLPDIGIDDSFFELGGHSLQATLLATRIQKTFGVRVTVREIFLQPTVRELAARIREARSDALPPIARVERTTAEFPASAAQARMYILQMMNPASTAYNISKALRIEGKLEASRLEAALQQLAARHEPLRTSLHYRDGKVWQRLHEPANFALAIAEVSERHIHAALQQHIRPFDLAKPSLFRAVLFRMAPNLHMLFLDLHHSIADATSLGVLLDELQRLYAGERLPEAELHYIDYSMWEQEGAASNYRKRQEQYWLKQFAALPPVLQLPTDKPRSDVQNDNGRTLRVALQREQADVLKQMALSSGTTLFAVLLSAYAVLLWKYSGEDDLVIGIPVSGRTHGDVERMVGMFVNTLPIRCFPRSELSVQQWLEQVGDTVLAAMDAQDYPFDELVEQLKLERGGKRNPLFDTMFVMQNAPLPDMRLGEVTMQPQEVDPVSAMFDLVLECMENEDGLQLKLEYRAALFAPDTVERVAGHYMQLLREMARKPHASLDELNLLSDEERQLVLHKFAESAQAGPLPARMVVEQFTEQAKRTPHQPAVQFGERMLTYRELDRLSEAWAHTLRQCGAEREQIVGVAAERGIIQIAALLAVWKAGAAYLPIDPEYPEERVAFMIADSGLKLLLTDGKLIAAIPQEVRQLRLTDDGAGGLAEVAAGGEQAAAAGGNQADAVGTGQRNDGRHIGNSASHDLADARCEMPEQGANRLPVNRPGDLAYVLYTSGTTGRPKGVMVEHRNVAAYVSAFRQQFRLTTADVVLQQAAFTFDVFVEEVFPALAAGATIAAVSKEELRQIPLLAERLAKSGVTVISCSPLLLNELNRHPIPDSLRLVISGGDVLKRSHVARFLERCEVYNTYGPTETTVCASYGRVEPDQERISIGRPIAHYKVYILDDRNLPVPVGMPGQLCIAGAGVSRGYLGRPEGMEEAFIPSPFCEGDTLYRTGDRAKWTADGALIYLGRVDQQVSIRGYRVEPGEIERVLQRHEAVREAAVACRTDGSGDSYLCAYILANRDWSRKELRSFMARYLPDYMLPSFVVELDALPMTVNGKLDMRALPDPRSGQREQSPQAAPRNEMDLRLIEIWKAVLDVEDVGLTDDFFELGGHSLKALALAHRIGQEWGLDVPVTLIFEASRLADMSDELQAMEAVAAEEAIPALPPQPHYPLSSAQKRLYFIEQMEGASTAYNMPAAFRIEGELYPDRLARAWRELIRRHEALRTSYVLADGEPRMVVHAAEAVESEVKIAPMMDERAAREEMQHFVRPFDLSRAPLCRMQVLPLAQQSSLVLIDVHHLAADAVTIELLFRDFEALYLGRELPPLSVQYKEFAAWQQAPDGRALRQRAYWLDRLAGDWPLMRFPTDYPKGERRELAGEGRVSLPLGTSLSRQVEARAVKHKATPYMYMLAAYFVLLSKYTSQHDLIVGIPVVGRSLPVWEQTAGMFVNTLALRQQPAGDKSFEQFLAETKEALSGAFRHQDAPLESVVEELQAAGGRQGVAMAELLPTLFSYREERESYQFAGHSASWVPLRTGKAKFDFAIEAVRQADGYEMELVYASDLFRIETMEAFLRHYIHILDAVLEQEERSISSISLLSREAALRQLERYNPPKREMAHLPIHYAIEAQAASIPDRIAAVHNESALRYSELNGKANALAVRLRGRGIGKGSYVPVWMDRSFELVISLLAVMKAGAAFVPMDVNWPDERSNAIISAAGAKLVLSAAEHAVKLPRGVVDQVEVVAVKAVELPLIPDLAVPVEPEDAMYVIYTSGSTGTPKGVVVPHKGIANRFYWMDAYFGEEAVQSVLQTTSHVFDSAVWQLYWPLTRGGRTVLPDGERLLHADYLTETIERHQVTLVDFVPSVFQVIVDQLVGGAADWTERLRPVTSIIVGGEEAAAGAIQAFRRLRPEVQITNLYGPTEASIGCVSYEIRGGEGRRIPIGRPIPNVQIMLLDRDLHVVPPGVAGEIYIAGDCLALGYLHDPERTADAFLPHAFPESGWTRMYKTGDLARYLPDGNLEYLGRIDNQVQIRGLRIELGEIEFQLLQTGMVKEAVVTVAELEGEPLLCAYITAEEKLDLARLKQELSAALPRYMVPAIYCQLDEMPLSASGKVNRRALPKPEAQASQERSRPADELEQQLLEIWQTVLGRSDIGTEDDFFATGGHSLKLFALAARIRQHFGIQVSLKDLYEATTIQGQARKLRQLQPQQDTDAGWSGLEFAETKDEIIAPASAAQKALYVIHNMEGVGTSYNMPQLFALDGQADVARLKQAVRQLVQRHEALRTRFVLEGGELRQHIGKESIVSWSRLEEEGDGLSGAMERFVQPFRLDEAPLYRIGELQHAGHTYLFMDMHHIISDGVSLAVLLDDLAALYEGVELSPLPLQYRHFAAWQQRMLAEGTWAETERFWMRKFTPLPAPLELPTDFPRPAVQSFAGGTVEMLLEESLTNNIRELQRTAGVTTYMLMLASFSVLLAKYTGSEDVAVGTPVSGRLRTELEPIVGMFVNTLPMRTFPRPDMHFAAYLQEVRSQALQAMDRQEYPLEELVRQLNIPRDSSRTPIFTTLLAVEQGESSSGKPDKQWLRPIELAGWTDRTVKFDLVMTVDETEGIAIRLEYASALFAESTAQLILQHFKRLLEQVTADRDVRIADIALLERADRPQAAALAAASAGADFDF
ncbi:amino acid adenylation domain-containing protein [Xylanibacillus composti]|uniref:Carrier domain-containing protein n=1 Tax=Xylanibacillus composti TaxID=1572762 RepID=A0A8J4M2U1_9BACL|nr:non-ribosomal peptide synthetase [Xylanibacillus composti]MDT9724047.1 amino acid adenylation domain-containing protein [Xylanibacillus composti]GIQ69440.1 hypothetical protein XYCOK13_22640 [Xylanibacillus composti]